MVEKFNVAGVEYYGQFDHFADCSVVSLQYHKPPVFSCFHNLKFLGSRDHYMTLVMGLLQDLSFHYFGLMGSENEGRAALYTPFHLLLQVFF